MIEVTVLLALIQYPTTFRVQVSVSSQDLQMDGFKTNRKKIVMEHKTVFFTCTANNKMNAFVTNFSVCFIKNSLSFTSK